MQGPVAPHLLPPNMGWTSSCHGGGWASWSSVRIVSCANRSIEWIRWSFLKRQMQATGRGVAHLSRQAWHSHRAASAMGLWALGLIRRLKHAMLRASTLQRPALPSPSCSLFNPSSQSHCSCSRPAGCRHLPFTPWAFFLSPPSSYR